MRISCYRCSVHFGGAAGAALGAGAIGAGAAGCGNGSSCGCGKEVPAIHWHSVPSQASAASGSLSSFAREGSHCPALEISERQWNSGAKDFAGLPLLSLSLRISVSRASGLPGGLARPRRSNSRARIASSICSRSRGCGCRSIWK